MKNPNRQLVVLCALVAGILFVIGWEPGAHAPMEIQWSTTPTSVWKTLVVVGAGENSYVCRADNNSFVRGRYYWFRARHLLDNGTTPWSKQIGAVWLTGAPPEATYIVPKDNSPVLRLP